MSEKSIIREYVIPVKGVDPEQVLQLCRPYMDSLCSKMPKEGWLNYTFHALQAEYFPENYSVEKIPGAGRAVKYFTDILTELFAREREELPFDPCRDFALLTEEEIASCSIVKEYERLKDCFGAKGVYVFMRLSQVCTPYDTLGHIAGVHHVAMYMARQLTGRNVPVDLGLMSGAALMHDMGKYGCRPEEGKRVPYLHYYYTYQYCRNNQLSTIGDIASNHSVWDLELENLSVESLLLIYADFRVKSVYDENRKEHIRFWSLDEAYDVILGKLDNVDEAKKKRYARVYAKLKDFEDYMLSLGCAVDLLSLPGAPEEKTYASVMRPGEIVDHFKNLAIRSNLAIMHMITREEQFISLLENVRSERDCRHTRACLTVIEEYSAYLAQDQKEIILDFLFDMLSHRDGDIRRQAAKTAAVLIAGYEIHFTKEIPAGYTEPQAGSSLTEVFDNFLCRLLYPEVSAPQQERRFAGFAMKTVLQTLLQQLDEEKGKQVLSVFISHCSRRYDSLTQFFLMDCSAEIPFVQCSREQADVLTDFAGALLSGEEGEESQVAALRFMLLWLRQGWRPEKNLDALIADAIPGIKKKPYSVQFLAARIREFFDVPSEHGMVYYDMTNLYMENQRSEVPWIYKFINLDILRKRQGVGDSPEQLYQYASHLLHMLQFSGQIVNRLQAGENLLDIVPLLSGTQCHEIVLELIRALEIEEYAVSRYIPPCLGRMFLLLEQQERAYILEQLRRLCCKTNNRTAVAALETAGKILGNCPEKLTEQEIAAAEGILCMGMADYRDEIAQEAFYIIGHDLFGSGSLLQEDKRQYFSAFARKILTLLNWEKLGMYVYFNGASLNRIYRFLNDYITDTGSHPLREKTLPVAFFPGTFDPFSLGHKQIVKNIREKGFRVWLAVDEFSWSKNPQPYEVRRKIIAMSVADIEDVYLFPEEIPVNIANPQDMRRLSDLFHGDSVYMVVGSDVVEHASAYRAAPVEGSVHHFPHLIFSRNEEEQEEIRRLKEVCRQRISGEQLWMKLPPILEQVSSTRIRENINAGRDICGLVDENVQNYIYQLGLYAMEPIYKKTARCIPVDMKMECRKEDAKSMELYTGGKSFARVEFHDVDASELMRECGSLEKAEKLRSLISGKTAMITCIEGDVTELDDGRLTVLNEVLEYFQENGYSFALCTDSGENGQVLELHGFLALQKIPGMYLLDLRRPLVVFYDTHAAIKESMAESRELKLAIRNSHIRLLQALTKAYPGRLILCFASELLNYRLMRLVTEENHVPLEPLKPAQLGEKMCVPFGKTLMNVKIPNTVTKELKTEKRYEKDLSSFSISQFPGYAPLPVQIRTICSFKRPVLLVDDLYHEGNRMKEIGAHLEKEGIRDVELITGVISGRGRDQARLQELDVRAVYTVPNLSSWIVESDLYPFLGGDGVVNTENAAAPIAAIPSVNTILPYEIPDYLKLSSLGSFYTLSQVCLENARDICKALEKEYRQQYKRQLTLERLGEAVAQPRYPDGLGLTRQMRQKSPSKILEEELDRLQRLSILEKAAVRAK